jgi:hypothetical protein
MAILAALESRIEMPFTHKTPLTAALKYISLATMRTDLPEGCPIYIDAVELFSVSKGGMPAIQYSEKDVPLRESLAAILRQADLKYVVSDGLLLIEGASSKDRREQ